jgi:hypothetical protein
VATADQPPLKLVALSSSRCWWLVPVGQRALRSLSALGSRRTGSGGSCPGSSDRLWAVRRPDEWRSLPDRVGVAHAASAAAGLNASRRGSRLDVVTVKRHRGPSPSCLHRPPGRRRRAASVQCSWSAGMGDSRSRRSSVHRMGAPLTELTRAKQTGQPLATPGRRNGSPQDRRGAAAVDAALTGTLRPGAGLLPVRWGWCRRGPLVRELAPAIALIPT